MEFKQTIALAGDISDRTATRSLPANDDGIEQRERILSELKTAQIGATRIKDVCLLVSAVSAVALFAIGQIV